MSNKHYEFDDVEQLARKAAGTVARKFGRHGTAYDDALSDIHEWMYTPRHRMKIDRWLASDPQQTSRIYWSFISEAQKPAERRKADRYGYDVDDVEYYSLQTVTSLLSLALDDNYDGMATPDRERKVDVNERVTRSTADHAEGGNTLAQVMDIRRAIAVVGSDPDAVVNYLGGPAPYVGRRRVVNNATAVAMTGREYEGE